MAKIECTNEQLGLIQDALELYSRIGILQIDRILDHPSIERMIDNQFRPKKDKLEVGDKTDRGPIVEVGKDFIKTKSFWSDWKNRASEETIKNNPDGWVEEIREWKDVDKIKLSVDWEKVHETRDRVRFLCNELKNIISGDPNIFHQNASYSIGRQKEGEHNTTAYDMIQVIRHEFWKQNPNRSSMTVDSSITKFGSKPLIKVEIK